MTTGVEVIPTRTLGIDEIELLAVGASVYGCGSGGSLIEGRILASALAGRLGRGRVGMVPLADLPDAARVAVPSTFARPRSVASIDAATRAFGELADRTGGPFDAVLPADLGVVSVLVAFAVAAELDVPVVDAGGAVRAAPHLDQTTWAAAGVVPGTAVLSDGEDLVGVDSDSVIVADRSVRALATGDSLQGSIAGATWAMRGPTARRSSLPGIVTAALEAGQAVDAVTDQGGDPVAELVRVVDGAVLAGRGPIAAVTVALHERTEHFEIRIDTDAGPIDVVSLDGHVQLRVDGEIVVGAPDLIAVVTPGGLGCTPRDLAAPAMEGQAVAVIAAPQPAIDALRVDPTAFASAHRFLGADEDAPPFSLS
ncbi:MAG: DUF917 family protein [Actinomycetota bacterium]